jgi:peptidylprolyl isomerase
MLGAGALAVLVVAVALSLRPGSDPVAAQQPTPMPPPAPASAGPAVARLGNQQIDLAELKSVLASLPAESREQLRANRGALETWLRSRLAQKAVLEQADAQGWRQRPEVEQQTRAAAEQIVFRDYMLSVSQVPADYPSAAELQQAYDSGKAQWVTPPLYRVSQIFLAVNDPQNLDAVRRQAQDLSRRAQAAPGISPRWPRSFPRTRTPPPEVAIRGCSRCSNWCRRCAARCRGSRSARSRTRCKARRAFMCSSSPPSNRRVPPPSTNCANA